MAHNFDFLSIAANGVQVTTGATTANVGIPTDANGVNRARYVRLAATGLCYVRPGNNTVTATASDILVIPGESLLLNVAGMTHIAHLQETAAAKLTISPVES